MSAVVIAAHNEEAVIGSCLDALERQQPRPAIVVSANGCTDSTVAVATRAGVIVVDRPAAGKAGALNAGDAVLTEFPRIYLDADIVSPPGAVAALADALAAGALVAVPARRVATQGRPWPVRAYMAINSRLPAFRTGLFGRGLIALSQEARARFDEFPSVIADDLYLDALFTQAERVVVDSVEVVVAAPHTTRELLNRLARVRRGNAQLRALLAGQPSVAVRPPDRWAWLRDVVLPRPWLLPAAVPYIVITLIAARRGRRENTGWGTDASTRHPARGAIS
ncbi:glycosyltransferase [Microbacterium aurum]|uniref:glycosyltransferase n=1 Tax=Microbacterium aurum TaxID=36805 RepID=UPI0028EEF1F4|nr:glycosyltransferase [Microbacterium aurum]